MLLASNLIGMYCRRNLCPAAGCRNTSNDGIRLSVKPRSRFASISVPAIPDSAPDPPLVTVRSAPGLQNDAAASMWNCSPVAGSFNGRGLYCARAGVAIASTRAATSPNPQYSRVDASCILPVS